MLFGFDWQRNFDIFNTFDRPLRVVVFAMEIHQAFVLLFTFELVNELLSFFESERSYGVFTRL